MTNRKGRNVALLAAATITSTVMVLAGAHPAAAPELDELTFTNHTAVTFAEDVDAVTASYEIATVNPSDIATTIAAPSMLDLARLALEDVVKVTTPPTGDQITAVGDSLMVGATPYLEELLPGISVDGRVGRPMPEGMGILDELAAQGEIREYVVLGLATNAGVTVEQFDKIIETVGPDTTIVIVNAYGDRSWIPGGNEQVELAAAKYPGQIVIADWNALIGEHPEYIGGDGIHANDAGKQAWAHMIVDALAQASLLK